MLPMLNSISYILLYIQTGLHTRKYPYGNQHRICFAIVGSYTSTASASAFLVGGELTWFNHRDSISRRQSSGLPLYSSLIFPRSPLSSPNTTPILRQLRPMRLSILKASPCKIDGYIKREKGQLL